MKTNTFLRRTLFLFLLCILMLQGVYLPASAKISAKNIQTVSGGHFVQENGKWKYQLADESYAQDILLKIDNNFYCFDQNGYRISGWKKIEGAYYYFGSESEGFMYRSKWLKTAQGNYYFLRKNGQTAIGWLTLKNRTYYLNARGKRLYGMQKVGKKTYYLGTKDAAYKRSSTLIRYKKNTYYVKKDGSLVTGWLTVDGQQYYFGKDYKAYTGKKKIKGVYYTFDSKGVLTAAGPTMKVTCDSAVLLDASNGKVLYSKNPNLRHANASTTKIMTCILALEKSKLTDVVTASEYAASMEPTKLYLHAGESFKMKDLLYSLMIPSHNDSAVAIAEHISGSCEKFATLMNEKAKEIGCTGTHFVTPNGLDNYLENGRVVALDHYTTARDLARIAQYAYKNSTFRSIVKNRSYKITSLQGNTYSFSTTNALLGTLPGVSGIKTGYTNKAGYCFTGAIKGKNGHTYISVVLGGKTSSSRWEDSKTLLTYAYNLS